MPFRKRVPIAPNRDETGMERFSTYSHKGAADRRQGFGTGKPVLFESGQHRIRTCDLYGVKAPKRPSSPTTFETGFRFTSLVKTASNGTRLTRRRVRAQVAIVAQWHPSCRDKPGRKPGRRGGPPRGNSRHANRDRQTRDSLPLASRQTDRARNRRRKRCFPPRVRRPLSVAARLLIWREVGLHAQTMKSSRPRRRPTLPGLTAPTFAG